MIQVSALYIYPIKSLGGISVSSVQLTDRGFQYDRRWMLIDENNRFLSQREHAAMALLQVAIDGNGLKIYHKHMPDQQLMIPLIPTEEKRVQVQIWNDTCNALLVSAEADAWFSQQLQCRCRLVYMPDDASIQIDERYAQPGEFTSFTDGYPILMIGAASLEDLNRRLEYAVPMNRFRPNLVISGSTPYQEDSMALFNIKGITCRGVKPSARCVVTTIDQDNAALGKEPLKTLASYRQKHKKVYFGQNVIAQNTGTITVGDSIQLTQVIA